MDRPEFATEALKFDDYDRVYGTYGPYKLRPVYQPIYEIADNSTAVLSGYEGLIRPTIKGKSIAPDVFFDLVDAKDKLFVECLCVGLNICGYKKAVTKGGGLFVNINVANYASVEVVEREFYYTFSQLTKHGLSRENIVFEILETEIIEPEILICLCNLIRNNGYKFALDDFGTRHSNVERYIAVQPNIIKLDRSLFITAMKSRETGKLLKSLISAFQENGVSVLLEGVENDTELMFARSMEVDMLQGFHLGKPNPSAAHCEKFIALPSTSETPLIRSVS